MPVREADVLNDFCSKGQVSFILGGQWGSEGKGAASAWLASQLNKEGRTFDVITTNAGVQSGHTSIHNGVKRVLYHLPTASVIASPGPEAVIYLNAGSVLDPTVLMTEMRENAELLKRWQLFIHPNAAIVTEECRRAENMPDSGPTKIASTRKGVGEAISRKVLRHGLIARDCPELKPYIRRVDLNAYMAGNKRSVLVEVPQGVGLSLNGKFYPHCTSRDSTVMQAMSDAHIHPSFLGQSMLVVRTFPIRVGNIPDGKGGEYSSGGHYPDQKETTWEDIGVEAEITTVTKRVRRVFTFSHQQLWDALSLTRPDILYVTFCDYIKDKKKLDALVYQIAGLARSVSNEKPLLTICQKGPTTDDAYVWRIDQ